MDHSNEERLEPNRRCQRRRKDPGCFGSLEHQSSRNRYAFLLTVVLLRPHHFELLNTLFSSLSAGINSKNVLRTLYGSVSPSGRALDGIAVVSDIMASKTPFDSAKSLSKVISSFDATTPISPNLTDINTMDIKSILNAAASLLTKVREYGPLVHQVSSLTLYASLR